MTQKTSHEAPWTLKDVLDWSSQYLRKAGSATARLDAELLISQATGLKRIEIYMYFDRLLNAEEKQQLRQGVKRRAGGEPVAHILGHKHFMDWTFKVSPQVLIPRVETELLVEEVSLFAKTLNRNVRILDVGSGSGCVGLSLAKMLPQAEVFLWDKSDDALMVAEANRQSLGLESQRAILQKKDALDPDVWAEAGEFDIIVSNPPYISESEYHTLNDSVRLFEPKMALVADDLGLKFYKMFATHLRTRLVSGGLCAVEIGYQQGADVVKLFHDSKWNNVQLKKDYSGLDRIVLCHS